jgi:flavin-dependent dehydrogenase
MESGRRRAHSVGETIPPDTRVDIQRLGTWTKFADDGHAPCHGSTSAWASDTLGHNDFVLNPYGSGWHLDRIRFDNMLLEHAVSSGATLARPTTLIDCHRIGADGFHVRVQSGAERAERTLAAAYVVDASGSRAVVGRMLGADRIQLDRLMFVYGYFDTTHASSTDHLTLLESNENGWWYAAALPDSRRAVAFASDSDIIRVAQLTRPAHWFARLLRTRHVAPRLDGCRFIPSSVIVKPASSSQLRPVTGHGWLAVGDAAASYDPISSQGIQKALADGIRAGESIATAFTGDADALDGYAEHVERAFQDYVANRNYLYQLEQRWQASPFWKRRHERTHVGPAVPRASMSRVEDSL